ncbi:hypothetical protein DS745_09335 [Anaerobacillus alkaliphilus]|uniref:Uncharacterized protein n=2 Tax=Anaerobacillus alkaliphilus TaxID=1548597 RepID=A0A4Q0VTF6_9BACI|nr:hypothetical protein DS745_09335 [Anaerobacillus alkaliphilus]
MKGIIEENSLLKNELLKTLDEKEKLVFLCEELLIEKQDIERKYRSLRNSKLGRLTIWYWERRRKFKNGPK